MVTGHQRRLDAVAHLQFLQDVGHVVFYGLFLDVQFRTDLLVAETAGHPAQDLLFPAGEVGKRITFRRTPCFTCISISNFAARSGDT